MPQVEHCTGSCVLKSWNNVVVKCQICLSPHTLATWLLADIVSSKWLCRWEWTTKVTDHKFNVIYEIRGVTSFTCCLGFQLCYQFGGAKMSRSSASRQRDPLEHLVPLSCNKTCDCVQIMEYYAMPLSLFFFFCMVNSDWLMLVLTCIISCIANAT